MKHLSALFAACSLLTASAQLNNGGFESLTADSLPEYWAGNTVILPVVLDSLGNAVMDSVVFDGANYLLNTSDVHSGSHAGELRNGYNYTADSAYPGSWFASPFQDGYGGFSFSLVAVVERPSAVDFWAKYAPLNADSAFAEVRAFDAAENEVGRGTLSFGGLIGTYTAFHVPIAYSASDEVAFISIRFCTATPTGSVTLGTRLLLDDVSIDYSANAVEEMSATDTALQVFPNPADGSVNVRAASGANLLGVRLLSLDGRIAQAGPLIGSSFPVSHLAPGRYTVEVRTSSGLVRAPLLIVR